MPEFFNIDLSEAQELKTLPSDVYEVTIEGTDLKTSDAGNPYVSVRMAVPSEPLSKDIFYNLNHPNSGSTPKARANLAQRAKEFYSAFSIDPETEDISQWVGKTGFAYLTTQEADGRYEERNNVKRFQQRRS